MKWILVMFIYSCYSPNELEVIYEGSNDYTVYSYDNHQCGIDTYSEDTVEDYDSTDEGPAEDVEPANQVYWSPPLIPFWR